MKDRVELLPIPFARQEFVKRSQGRNAVQKSAYISRSCLEFEGNCVLAPSIYDFSFHKPPAYQQVFLPDYVDERFKDPQVLWGAAEKAETRKNSQVATDNVVALPDEEEVTLEMKIKITKTLAKEVFTNHGLGVEVAIHFPTKHAKGEGISGTIVELRDEKYGIQINGKGRVIPLSVEELEKYDISEHNWHLHLLGTTRRFHKNGKEFGEKARDQMPQIRNNRIVSGCNLMPKCVEITNRILKEEGLTLRVELPSLMPQIHLGPVRMRGECPELMEVHEERKQLNEELAKNPENILIAISEKQSVFTKEDVERYISKHTPESHIEHVRENFWKLPDLIQLRDKKTHKPLALFSCIGTIEEERKIMRIAKRIDKIDHYGIHESVAEKFSRGLNKEQKKAYSTILNGSGVSILHGYAGTGKSYVLKALDSAYGASGVRVRAIGADNGAAEALRDKGIVDVQNIHQFLFKVNKYDKLTPEKNEVWIIDEASKLGNELLLELLKTAQTYKAKLIISGDPAQLVAIQRGGMFKVLSEYFESVKLVEIQRQKNKEDIEIVKRLAKGDTDYALDRLTARRALKWSETKSQSIENLVTDWVKDNKPEKGVCPPAEKSIVVTGTNAETRILNSLIRETRKEWGVIGGEDVECRTGYGTFQISSNDLIHFRGNNNKIGVQNGMRGEVVEVSSIRNEISVEIKGSGKKTRFVTFNLKEYKDFHLGYATNTDLSQGGTWGKVYILDSPRTTKEMLYVNLSRHTESCKYYAAQTEAVCLAELKLRGRRSGEKLTSFEHTHTDEIESKTAQAARQEALAGLKASKTLKTKMKGHFLSVAGSIAGQLKERVLDRNDLQKKEEVYDYKNRQIFKTEPVVDIQSVSGKLAELGTPKPFLKEKLLKEIDVDDFYARFFAVSAEASRLHLSIKNQARQQGVPEREVECFIEMQKAYEEKKCIGKIFVEGTNYQKLPIAQEWGADVEKVFQKTTKKFDDSFTPKDFFKKQEKTVLNGAWEGNYFASRRVLKYSKVESMILEIREEDTKGFAHGRQLAFEGNWYAYASLLESEKRTVQEAIYGFSTLTEKTEARITEKGSLPLKNAVESFLKSTNPTHTLFKENFSTKEKPLQEAESSYRHCLNEIGVLRREIAWQAGESGTRDFSECESYEPLQEEFSKREDYAIGFLAQLESRFFPIEETLEERFVSQIGYQTARFEERFQLSSLRNEESKKEFSNETVEVIKDYEEVSILALQLKRACVIEAVAQGKQMEKTEDFELYSESSSARGEVAKNLLKEIEKEGEEHFTEKGKVEVFRATINPEKQQAIEDYEERNRACAKLWNQKGSAKYKQADEERSRSAKILSDLLSFQEKQKVFGEKDGYFFEKACQKELFEERTSGLEMEKQEQLGTSEKKIEKNEDDPRLLRRNEMEEKEEAKETAVREEYSHWYKEVGRLGKIIEQEKRAISNRDIRKCVHYEEFNKACVNRNKAAFKARNFFGERLSSTYGKKATRFICIQAEKHEEIERKIQEKQFVSDPRTFGTFLSQNTERIIEKLFPEGAKTSSAKEWRFGEKNQLSVKRDGYFFDFETQEGGGLLKLIQKEMGTDSRGAVSWVKDTLGGFPTATSMTRRQEKVTTVPKKEDKWVSLRPDPTIPEPSRRASKDGFVEVSRYAYKDAEGNLLYYSVRMEDRKGYKRVVPLSFGYKEGKENNRFWSMKGYNFGKEKKTLYNLHLLNKYPDAPVVVVEGEKTADAAPNALKNIGRDGYISVSWLGGARSVAKTDWSPLAGRERILIWPDNDEAGRSAGKLIEKELFNIKIQKQEFKTVDPHWLQSKLPKGWDLADEWPATLSRDEKQEVSYGFRISELQDRFEFLSGSRKKFFGERLALSDLSVCFLEARRDSYEKEGFIGKTDFGKEKFLMGQAEELNKLLEKEEAMAKKLGQDPHINASGKLQQDLARQCTLFEVRHGREPNLSETLLMKDAIDESGKMLCLSDQTGGWECIKQRTLKGICERSIKIGSVSIPPAEEMQRQMEKETREVQKAQQRELEIQREMQRQQELDMSRGFSL